MYLRGMMNDWGATKMSEEIIKEKHILSVTVSPEAEFSRCHKSPTLDAERRGMVFS
jgi:hypothetical protein